MNEGWVADFADMRSPFNASTLFVPDDIELEYVNITQRIAGDATLPISDAFRWALAEVLNDFYEANFNISVSLRSIIPAESVSTKSVGPPCALPSTFPFFPLCWDGVRAVRDGVSSTEWCESSAGSCESSTGWCESSH